MFWEVNGTRGGKVYLLGSIHVGKEDLYPLPKEIYEAFDASNYLMVEVKMGPNSDAIMNNTMYKQGRYESSDSIKHHISAESYKRLETWIAQLKLPKGSMDRFRPWVAAVTLSMMDITRLGYSPIFGIDKHFENRATHLSKGIYGMENLSSQLNVFTEDNETYQENFLKSALDGRLVTDEDVESLFHAWKEGNSTYFEQKILPLYDNYPEVKKRLITERNEKMYERIKRFIESKKGRSYFVIVGLAHLLGPEGILAHLEAEGIGVKRY